MEHEQKAEKRRAKAKKAEAEFAGSTDPNVVDSSGHTTLMNSIGDLEAMKRELDAGAKPNIRAKRNKATALNLAAEEVHVEGVELLLNYRPKKYKTKVDNKCKNGATPLFTAVEKGNFEIVQLLVEAGADLEKKAYRAKTALHEAIYQENLEIAQFLLEKGADPNAVSGDGDLHPLRVVTCVTVSETRNLSMLKLLLRSGANPNDVKKERPLAALH